MSHSFVQLLRYTTARKKPGGGEYVIILEYFRRWIQISFPIFLARPQTRIFEIQLPSFRFDQLTTNRNNGNRHTSTFDAFLRNLMC